MKTLLRLALIFPLFAPAVVAQETRIPATVQSAGLPYEVIVTPNVTKKDLRQLIQQVEEDFFARFNELNIDDDYDVICYRYTPTNSHISRRVCEPNFKIRARADNASETAFALITGAQAWVLEDH